MFVHNISVEFGAATGGFTGTIAASNEFGNSVSNGFNLNGDGFRDLFVGCRYDDDGGYNRGAVFSLFLDNTGMALSHRKISDTVGSFTAWFDDEDHFGNDVASAGDMDLDGV